MTHGWPIPFGMTHGSEGMPVGVFLLVSVLAGVVDLDGEAALGLGMPGTIHFGDMAIRGMPVGFTTLGLVDGILDGGIVVPDGTGLMVLMQMDSTTDIITAILKRNHHEDKWWLGAGLPEVAGLHKVPVQLPKQE